MKKKQIFITLTAMALTAALTIGGTLAYLSAITEERENVFSSSGDLDGWIEETEWEGDKTDYYPGEAVAKNPQLVLKAGSNDAFAAATIICVDNDGNEIDLDDFESTYGKIMYKDGDNKVNGINPVWQKVEGTKNMYVLKDANGLKKLVASVEDIENKRIPVDAPTPTMFDEVEILTGIQEVISENYKETIVYDKDGNEIEKTEISSTTKSKYIYDKDGKLVPVPADFETLPKFSIKVQGYLVQTEGLTDEEAETELKALATSAGKLRK